MRKAKTFIFILLAVMTLTTLASAAPDINIVKYETSYDFFLGAYQSEPTVCSCSSAIDTVQIINTGSYGAIFTLTTNQPDKIIVGKNNVQLEPGQSTDIDLIVEADCDDEYKEDYVVTVESNLGTKKKIERTLTAQKCQSLSATLYADKEQIKPCQQNTYKIEIKNPAPFPEEYRVVAKSFSEYFTYPEYSLTLTPGQTGVVEMNMTPACDIYGEQEVKFEVTSKNNDLSADLSHLLQIEQDYAFVADFESINDVCIQETSYLPITITNMGSVENSYSASVSDGIGFIEDNNITLKPGDEGEIMLNAKPSEVGTYTFTLTIKSEIGDQVLVENVTLSAQDCYNINIEILGKENPDVCGGEHEYDVKVSNNGFFDESVYLGVSGDAQLSEDVVEVTAGSDEYVTLTINSPANESRLYDIYITAGLNEREYTGFWTDAITVNSHSDYECHRVELIDDKTYARYYEDKAYFGLKNTGYEAVEYDVDFEGPGFAELEDDKIYLEPGQEEYFLINLELNGTEPGKNPVVLTFDSGKMEYQENLELRLSDTPILEQWYSYFTQNACFTTTAILILVLIIALIVMIVRLLMPSSSYQGQGMFAVVLAILGLITVLVMLLAYGWPTGYAQPLPEQNIDDPTIAWYEDHDLTVDLSEFFNDPDNDVLTYEVEDGIDNISYSLDESVVTFKPDEDWFGNRRVRFTATDPEGEEARSPRMTLLVVDYPEFSWGLAHSVYCKFMNLVLFLLILIVIAVTPWRKKPNGEDKVAYAGVKKEKGYHYYVDSDGDVAKKRVKRKTAKKRK